MYIFIERINSGYCVELILITFFLQLTGGEKETHRYCMPQCHSPFRRAVDVWMISHCWLLHSQIWNGTVITGGGHSNVIYVNSPYFFCTNIKTAFKEMLQIFQDELWHVSRYIIRKCEACLEYEAVHLKIQVWSTQSWTAGEKQIKFLLMQASYVVMLLWLLSCSRPWWRVVPVLCHCVVSVVISSKISFSTLDFSHTFNTQLWIKHSIHSILGFSAA